MTVYNLFKWTFYLQKEIVLVTHVSILNKEEN